MPKRVCKFVNAQVRILSWFNLVLVVLGLPLSAKCQDLVLIGGRVYATPTAAPIDDAVVVIYDGKIASVGKQDDVRDRHSAAVVDCHGKVIVAGFWNSHVHFETGWQNAAGQPADNLEVHMADMLTRWGFTTVWDLSSDPKNTMALRRRIAGGEIAGPTVLMAGAIFPKNGHPIYLPAEMQVPEAATPQAAEDMARAYLKMGFDGIKLFTGSYMGSKPVVNMNTSTVKAGTDVAHANAKPVFAHPQNQVGVDNALAGGVDILAHTVPGQGSFTVQQLAEMKQRHTALIPTLMEWTTVFSPPQQDRMVRAGVDQVKQYLSAGGTILFGTDVGYQSKYDPTEEFELMGQAMGWRDILASLTLNPSVFFKAPSKGRVEKGMDADLVVLNADPAIDVRNFSSVAYTIRGGRVIYAASKK